MPHIQMLHFIIMKLKRIDVIKDNEKRKKEKRKKRKREKENKRKRDREIER